MVLNRLTRCRHRWRSFKRRCGSQRVLDRIMKLAVKVATGVHTEDIFFFSVNRFTTGSGLLKKVVSHPKLDIYGAEWLGLEYLDARDSTWLWLRSYKRVLKHSISSCNPLNLSVLYFPIDLSKSSLFCNRTMTIFYRCISDLIHNESIITSTPRMKYEDEIVFRLAALSLQIKHGNWNQTFAGSETSNSSDYLFQYRDLLPERFYRDYTLEWKEKLFEYHKKHVRMEEKRAITEYLKLAQSLPMYGVHYFKVARRVTSGPKEALYLGIHTGGINIYSISDKRNPITRLPWSEIVTCSYLKTGRLKFHFVVHYFSENMVFIVARKRLCKLMRMIAKVNKNLYLP